MVELPLQRCHLSQALASGAGLPLAGHGRETVDLAKHIFQPQMPENMAS